MGLIKAALSAVSGTLADSWKEYFVCDSLSNDILIAKGVKKSTGLFDKSSSDVITDGSGIVVNEGQCALIVENGQVLEVANEAGSFTFSSSISPTIFTGGLTGLKETFEEMLKRFTYNGVANKSQRIYYVNTKEIMGNLFGTTSPIPFRIVDKNVGLDMDTGLRCNGEYTFQIVNPILFYKSVSGNISSTFDKENIASVMKSELLNALQPALAKISAMGIRYYEISGHTLDLTDILNEQLSSKWSNLRGIKIVNMSFNSITLPKEDEDKIKNLQTAATMKDPAMLAANLAAAQADAMRDAANNPAGAGIAMMGVNIMSASGESAIVSAMNQAKAQPQTATNTWTCACGTTNTGNYCSNCGTARNAKKTCPVCHQEVDAASRYCPICGAKL